MGSLAAKPQLFFMGSFATVFHVWNKCSYRMVSLQMFFSDLCSSRTFLTFFVLWNFAFSNFCDFKKMFYPILQPWVGCFLFMCQVAHLWGGATVYFFPVVSTLFPAAYDCLPCGFTPLFFYFSLYVHCHVDLMQCCALLLCYLSHILYPDFLQSAHHYHYKKSLFYSFISVPWSFNTQT